MAPRNHRRDTESLVRAKAGQGASQKAIASALGISVWQVRTILRKKATHKIQERVFGKIRLKKVTKSKETVTKAIVLSDIHVPDHDQKALALAIAYMKDAKPDIIVLNGDIADFIAPSKYPKDPDLVETFADELSETVDLLRTIRKNHPSAAIYYTQGNHEHRVERYLYDKAPALCSLPELGVDRLLKMNEFDIQFVDGQDSIMVGSINIHHGSIIRKHSGDSVQSHVLSEGISTLMGHVHRMGVYYKTDRNGTLIGIENGHLSRPDPDYAGQCPNWQCGFSEIHYCERSKHTMVRQHHIVDGKLIVDGTLYTAK